jgi:hypothetical protein
MPRRDPKLRRPGRRAMPCRSVLYQGLEDERWNKRVPHVGFDVPRHAQPIAKPYELDVDEPTEIVNLLGQCDLRRHSAVQRRP